MIYVLKMDKNFITILQDKFYEKKLMFKDLSLFFSIEYFDFSLRDLHLDIRVKHYDTTIDGDYISDETLYLLYNENKERFISLEDIEFKTIQDNLDYKNITLDDFSVIEN